ncbi:MAG: protein-glutamate O-methyltransferase CheR [Pirellulales bacterium]|nr:protein-glutamate O-methyltransferase CheR [Pirellulales bacterium]
MSPPELLKPASFETNLVQVTDSQLARYARMIYDRTGIRVSPHKKTLLSNRLRRRLRETGIAGFDAYYEHLRRLRPNDPEWDAFLQEITTHETYLFRDEVQWDWFRQRFLPDLVESARSGGRPRRLWIWSAACSTGDEPYTIACCIAAGLPDLSTWEIRVLGTDIGAGALEKAEEAVFCQRAMHLVRPEHHRFFTKARDAHIWQAKPILRKMVSFRRHNLMEPLAEGPFDLVVLKNVLIYFDVTSKKRVLENVRSRIRAGGLLMAGAADGVADLVRDYQRIQPWLFQRPLAPNARSDRRER